MKISRENQTILWLSLFLAVFLGASVSWGQSPPVEITVTTSSPTYPVGEPIKIQVNLANISGSEVITRSGFMDQDFHLLITFTLPDGTIINSPFQGSFAEPGPLPRFGGKDAVFVEVIPAGWEDITLIPDVREFYDLSGPGRYTARLLLPMETFGTYAAEEVTGTLYAFTDDPDRESFNPVASNAVTFTVEDPRAVSLVDLLVNQVNVGPGTNPEVRKTPLDGVLVKLFRTSDIPEDYLPANSNTYGFIWNDVDPVRSALTGNGGAVRLAGLRQDAYLALGRYEQSSDFRYFGAKINSGDRNWTTENPVVKNLNVMVRSDGTALEGETILVTGSELLITKPAFVTWDADVELYPFVFETVGEWGVITTVEPPEGFVADYDALSAEVSDEIESVQFTITDVGSAWVETKVVFDLVHKGKKQKIKTSIGVRLSRELAEEKGVSVYGDMGKR